jgi:hydrogenase assembly chaperone HypC/HupF
MAMTKRLGKEGRMCLGIPGKVVEVFREHDLIMGKVDFGGVCKRVCLEAVPGIEVGDYALVHVGFAIARINELEARRVFALLEAMNELDELKHGETDEVPRRIPRPGGGREVAAGDPGRDDPALDADGNLRRPDAYLVKYGSDELLPPEISPVHDPGCPVCVTPLVLIDKAVAIASRRDVIFCSFGDLLRVPGSERDHFALKAGGGDVHIVYSPLDCLRLAQQHPDRTVVFFTVGFGTTGPANATAIGPAQRRGVRNFAALVSHVRMPPAMTRHPVRTGQWRAGPPGGRPRLHDHGLLGIRTPGGAAPGTDRRHRLRAPRPVRRRLPLHPNAGRVPLRRGEPVRPRRDPRGNPHAILLSEAVFEVTERKWRGIGPIPESGYRLRLGRGIRTDA